MYFIFDNNNTTIVCFLEHWLIRSLFNIKIKLKIDFFYSMIFSLIEVEISFSY